MDEQSVCIISKDELRDVLASYDIPLGIRMHILREYHYQHTGNHLSEHAAQSIIAMVDNLCIPNLEDLVHLCSHPIIDTTG